MSISNSHNNPVLVAVIGNVAFDVLCYPVDEVPRSRSMTFEQSEISPGGCGSNTAIGLAALDIPTTLIASIGDDIAGDLALAYWHKFGVQTSFIKVHQNKKTGVSIGLIDREGQPRFVHTTGTNALLQTRDCNLDAIAPTLKSIHIAGYFLLPGLLDDQFPIILEKWQKQGILITMDVAQTPRMADPEPLWKCLPHVDIFFCNELEAELITGKKAPREAAACLLEHQAGHVILKLGSRGCLLANQTKQEQFPGILTEVVDTTGAGDAFAAGFIASYLKTQDLTMACQSANRAGAKTVRRLGALAAWI